MPITRPLALLAMLACAPGLGTSKLAHPTPVDLRETYPGVYTRIDRIGRLLIGGQPDEATLRTMFHDGVRTVINLRTPAEMDNRDRVSFDEASLLEELGARSILVPIGSPAEFPYRPEAIDALALALTSTDGDVLLHCQSGWRTAWTYAGFLVREQGHSLDAASAVFEELVDDHRNPFLDLLGIRTSLQFASDEGEQEGLTAPVPSYAAVPQTGLHAMPIEPAAAVNDFEGAIQSRHYRAGPLDICGQPTPDAFREFRERGVTVVINLRTPSEMANREYVDFDEAALLAELGIDYVWIPLGGDDNPYSPVAVDAFARALAEHEGRAVLHCTVAWRASLMWGAYLVRHRGYDVNTGLEEAGRIVDSSPPLSGLLGRKIVHRPVVRSR